MPSLVSRCTEFATILAMACKPDMETSGARIHVWKFSVGRFVVWRAPTPNGDCLVNDDRRRGNGVRPDY